VENRRIEKKVCDQNLDRTKMMLKINDALG
jgi:hypothetical protein